MTTVAIRQHRYRLRKARKRECWLVELPEGLAEELVLFVRPDIDIDDRQTVARKLSALIIDLYKKRYA